MLLLGLSWLVLSLFVGVLASKIGREGFTWALVAAIISPLFALIGLLVVGKAKDDVTTNNTLGNEDLTNDKEWSVIKKYVPEVQSSLDQLNLQLDGQSMLLAESKLKELFNVMGKDGLTPDAIKIIVDDTLSELMEKNSLGFASEVSTQDNSKESSKVDLQLIAKLKGSKKKIGFSKVPQQCDICNSAKTQQLIDEHYVCGGCKMSHL